MGCGDLKSVPEVRHGLRELLGRWGGREAADVAELLASELVTNALIHTDHGAVVTATVGTSTLRVEVRDFVAGFPEPPPALTAVNAPSAGASIGTGIGTGAGSASDPDRDDAEAMPDPDLLETHGRGLALVQSLADSWGVHTQHAGKVVWFELNAMSA
ncbi:ATP-binding protein [Streptomyces sp. NPDC017979]|uniref:ATP-binding protein n=1 Tax=Streptomyces sp. NPDC017979 TaxID=3365024 RepID=UPI0037A3494D